MSELAELNCTDCQMPIDGRPLMLTDAVAAACDTCHGKCYWCTCMGWASQHRPQDLYAWSPLSGYRRNPQQVKKKFGFVRSHSIEQRWLGIVSGTWIAVTGFLITASTAFDIAFQTTCVILFLRNSVWCRQFFSMDNTVSSVCLVGRIQH